MVGLLGWLTHNTRIEPPFTVALPTTISSLSNLLAANPAFGTILSPATHPSFQSELASRAESEATISLGAGQRSVRIAGWSVVKAVVKFLQWYAFVSWIQPLVCL